MTDVFQIFAGSADAAPGKGAGETLVSPAATYKELRAIPHWRRTLSNFAVTPFQWKGRQWKTLEHAFQAAKFETIDPELFRSFSLNSGSALSRGSGEDARSERKAVVFTAEQKAAWDARMPALQKELWEAKFSQNPDARKVLLLTGDAQLWHAAPRTPKVHWTDLEEIRGELRDKQNAPEPTEMADAADVATPEEVVEAPVTAAAEPKAKKTAAKSKAKKTTNTAVPEGNVTTGEPVVAPPTEVTPPDMDAPEKKESAIRFCPVCRYYLYLQVLGEDQTLLRLCRNCGYKEEDDKGGLVMEMSIQEQSTEGYKILLNEFTRQDPRLPHIRKTIKCPDPACKSNHGETESDVIYIKHDPVNMLYLYICDVCGYQWRSGR
jgi:predicted NAD-dependent protein-ADP-ribosyltransferase YbiA (DUF1768 family)/DNA-directed RNA polymerase subunit M/transcription elongation factor TFIIS